jgi:hypothetical protein
MNNKKQHQQCIRIKINKINRNASNDQKEDLCCTTVINGIDRDLMFQQLEEGILFQNLYKKRLQKTNFAIVCTTITTKQTNKDNNNNVAHSFIQHTQNILIITSMCLGRCVTHTTTNNKKKFLPRKDHSIRASNTTITNRTKSIHKNQQTQNTTTQRGY